MLLVRKFLALLSPLSSIGPLYWYPGICRLIKLLEIKSAIINYHSNVRLGAQIEFHVNFSSAEERRKCNTMGFIIIIPKRTGWRVNFEFSSLRAMQVRHKIHPLRVKSQVGLLFLLHTDRLLMDPLYCGWFQRNVLKRCYNENALPSLTLFSSLYLLFARTEGDFVTHVPHTLTEWTLRTCRSVRSFGIWNTFLLSNQLRKYLARIYFGNQPI